MELPKSFLRKLNVSFKTVLLLSVYFLIFEAKADFQSTKNAPRFDRVQIKIGNKNITVELAKTGEQLSYGLMFRKKLSKDTGMLFAFSGEEIRKFWMKNTFVNLAIGFFDKNKKLIDIQEMRAVKSIMEEPLSYTSKLPAMYALEMPEFWFKNNGINVDDVFEFVSEKKNTNTKKDI